MNPYKVLEIDRHASKREIISAAALALRKRRFTGREIAEAQRELLDPVSRAANDFLHFIDVHSLQMRPERAEKIPADKVSVAGLKRLTIFDENP